MPFVKYNPNPNGRESAGDCTVRAVSKIMDWDWERTYMQLSIQGFQMGDVFSANAVWITFLLNNGFKEHSLMSLCKDCYTLEKFAKDIQPGKYCISDGNHVVAVIRESTDAEAKWFDTWNSKNMIPIFYLEKVKEATNNE